MIYNKNIQIIDENPSIKTDLKDNEYFALMVMDLDTPTDDRDWFNAEKKYVGLSCTSEKRIYISKDWRKTHDKWRGIDFNKRVGMIKIVSRGRSA